MDEHAGERSRAERACRSGAGSEYRRGAAIELHLLGLCCHYADVCSSGKA